MSTKRFATYTAVRSVICFGLVLLGIPCVVSSTSAQAVVSSEFISAAPPTAQSHASTLVETPAGLVVAWFGGKQERDPGVGIWLARQVDGH